MTYLSRRLLLALTALLLTAAPAAAQDWRPLDPENTLVIETTKGRIIVELRPDFAPLAVARIKQLTRDKTYDGLLFHRVVDHFVDQTGDPGNKDAGMSKYPNLPGEFRFRLKPGSFAPVVKGADRTAGFVGATPFEAEALSTMAQRPDGTLGAWGDYCPGVAGMGRDTAEDTANAEFFFMRDASHHLDHSYTVFGRAIVGLDVVRAIAIGEPPAHPDKMLRVWVMADMPLADRPRLEVADTTGPAFKALVARVRRAKGADFSVCDVEVPVRVVG
jgi:peptidylprolyl isomerase